MPDCLFCKIIAGEIPSQGVLETDHAYAFRDINPGAPVHVLVVPRRHIDSVAAVTPADAETLTGVFAAIQDVAAKEGLAERGYRVVANVGEDAGMTVHHLHFHVVGGQPMGWPPGTSRTSG